MKIYIDGCSEEALLFAQKIGIGITTNPSIILKESFSKDLMNVIRRLTNLNVSTIFFQVENLDEEILEQLDPKKFVIKIPWVVEKYNLCTPLRERGFKVCATAVYEISQLVFALNFGVDYVAFYYDRAKRRGIDPNERIRQFKQIIENSEDTKLVVASLKSTEQVIDAIISGADEVAIPFDVFNKFALVPEYVEEDVKRFSEDFKRLLPKVNGRIHNE
ncbi:transaldolase family protein [Thermotoga profunda]|uniref:transaldolase family protein n=1 Tax=Thermotoga profunda TaxID=1508420 RepID=UPI0005973009|nr:transaldolase family protein [Thermotoga profunda]